jgi:hypothetical protein
MPPILTIHAQRGKCLPHEFQQVVFGESSGIGTRWLNSFVSKVCAIQNIFKKRHWIVLPSDTSGRGFVSVAPRICSSLFCSLQAAQL